MSTPQGPLGDWPACSEQGDDDGGHVTFVCGWRSHRVEGSVSALAERWRVNAAVVTVSRPRGASNRRGWNPPRESQGISPAHRWCQTLVSNASFQWIWDHRCLLHSPPGFPLRSESIRASFFHFFSRRRVWGTSPTLLWMGRSGGRPGRSMSEHSRFTNHSARVGCFLLVAAVLTTQSLQAPQAPPGAGDRGGSLSSSQSPVPEPLPAPGRWACGGLGALFKISVRVEMGLNGWTGGNAPRAGS